MKIYTRTGDNRTIGLFEGQRVSNNWLRVEAYGAVDELNAQLGLGLLASEGGQLRERIALHLSRTVCCCSEPRVITPEREAQVNEQARLYLNRLNDVLFV